MGAKVQEGLGIGQLQVVGITLPTIPKQLFFTVVRKAAKYDPHVFAPIVLPAAWRAAISQGVPLDRVTYAIRPQEINNPVESFLPSNIYGPLGVLVAKHPRDPSRVLKGKFNC